MNGQDIRRLEMLVRVRDFGAAHAALFPSSTLGGQTFAAVGAAVASLNECAALQRSGREEVTTARAAARKALREMVDAVLRTARAIAVDCPGIDANFPVPPTSTDHDLHLVARVHAREAAPLAAEFISHAMPEDFLAELKRLIDEFDRTLLADNSAKAAQLEAGFRIQDTIATAFDAVRRLDAIVQNTLRDDPTMLGVWEQLRRLDLRPGRRRTPARRAAQDVRIRASDVQ